MEREIICIDFDGVIHSYEHGWQDGDIYGTVVEGFWEWALIAQEKFKLVIYSSRSSDPNMLVQMHNWLNNEWQKYCTTKQLIQPIPNYHYTREKPAAFITIDDRAITFKGDWSAPELTVEAMLAFKPWNVK